MAEPRTASISLDALGMGTVKVDGHDISDSVRGLTLSARAGHVSSLVLDLRVDADEFSGEAHVYIPAETAATLVALGWTPPDDDQPVDLTDPKRHDQIIRIIRAEAARDPNWLRILLRREPRRGSSFGIAPQLVKVDGVLTEGDADTAREALRQTDDDPHGLQAGMIVKPYTERGERKWVFRCWGTDDGCDGWLSLDHGSQTSAERARDRHIAEAHQQADGTPR